MPSQTLARVVECNNFQDARKFLASNGQKGRQRGILREGVYAINIALFNVITEDRVFTLEWAKSLEEWQHQLKELDGFSPLIISGQADQIGIVTVHEGPTLAPGRTDRAGRGHRQGPAELPQQLPGHRGVPGCRRTPRPAIHAADRRHLFPQPLVLHGRIDSEAGRAHRPGRRGRQLLRQEGRRHFGQGVSPRRARPRRREGRLGNGASALENTPSTRPSGQVVLVPTTNFVLALDHGPDGTAPLRRHAEIHRTDHVPTPTSRRCR